MASINAIRAQTGKALDCVIAGGAPLAGLPILPYPLIWEYDVATQRDCGDPSAWYPTLNLVQIQRDRAPSFWEGVGQDIISAGRGFLASFDPLSFARFANAQVQKAEQRQEAGESLVQLKQQFDVKGRALVAGLKPEVPMAFDSEFGFGSIFDSVIDFGGGLVSELGGVSGILETATPFISQALFQPQQAIAMPVAASAAAVRQAAAASGALAMRTGAVVGRSFFNRFPNLATAIQKMRNAGQNIKRSQLYSMLRRFGPEFLITGGILTAAAVSELMMAGPGHRRMNPANVKALRRSMRRLKSFHNLCVDTDQLRSRGRRRAPSGSCKSGGISVVKAG